jgi:hypothetical protein
MRAGGDLAFRPVMQADICCNTRKKKRIFVMIITAQARRPS